MSLFDEPAEQRTKDSKLLSEYTAKTKTFKSRTEPCSGYERSTLPSEHYYILPALCLIIAILTEK